VDINVNKLNHFLRLRALHQYPQKIPDSLMVIYPKIISFQVGVGRNKTFRAQARISVSGIRHEEYAENATTRSALRQAQDRLGWFYSGLRLLFAIAENSEINP
jgi:hypothetical protein